MAWRPSLEDDELLLRAGRGEVAATELPSVLELLARIGDAERLPWPVRERQRQAIIALWLRPTPPVVPKGRAIRFRCDLCGRSDQLHRSRRRLVRRVPWEPAGGAHVVRHLLSCAACFTNRRADPRRCAWGACYEQCRGLAEPRSAYCMGHELLEGGHATGAAALGRRDAAAYERRQCLERAAEALEPLLRGAMTAAARWRQASTSGDAATALDELRRAGELWCEKQLEHPQLGFGEAIYATLLALRQVNAGDLHPILRLRVDALRKADLSKPRLRRQAALVGLVDDVPVMLRVTP
jgi:hypothetical protein